jgi:hypothetical protein
MKRRAHDIGIDSNPCNHVHVVRLLFLPSIHVCVLGYFICWSLLLTNGGCYGHWESNARNNNRPIATSLAVRGGISKNVSTNESSIVTTSPPSLFTSSGNLVDFTPSEEDVEETEEDYEEEQMQISPPSIITSTPCASSITSTPMSLSEKLFEVQSLRSQGKVLHDNGEFEEAAQIFGEAARILSDEIVDHNVHPSVTSSAGTSNMMITTKKSKTKEEEDFINEAATCYMHQALCQLKNNDVEECVQTLSSKVLGDATEGQKQEEEQSMSSSATSSIPIISNNIILRSRAYHRRAKAKYRLGDVSGAIADAKYAAFLGDPHAATFYGKLILQQQQGQGNNHDINATITSSSTYKQSPTTESLPTDSILSLLMSNSMKSYHLHGEATSSNNVESNLNVSSMIRHFGKQLLEDEDMRSKLCSMVQTVGSNPSTVRYLATTVGGIPTTSLSDSTVDQLCNLCRQVTPTNVQKVITLTKRSIRTLQVTSKAIKLITKNRHLLVYFMLLLWIRRTIILDRRRILSGAL